MDNRTIRLSDAIEAIAGLVPEGRRPEGVQFRVTITIADAIEALSALPAVEGWLPIESAPKDVAILLAWPNGGGLTIGKFDPDKYAKKPRPLFSGHWRGRVWERENQPTHWQPLPAPPEIE